MSQAAVRLRDPVDLEEFERKLRSAAPDPKQGGDPLQELSRLIGVQKDSLDQLFAETKAPAAPVAKAGVAPRIDIAHIDERLFRPAGQPVSQPKAPFEDPADISALLNQFPDAAARFAAAAPPAAPAAQDQYNEPMPPFAAGYDEPSVGEAGYRSGYDEPQKSRRPLLLMGAALVVLIGGIGAVVVSRNHGPTGTPTIQASNTPVKVAPAASDTPDQAQQVSVLDKANTERLAASRVVTREEQPVDIRAQARANGTATSGVIAMPAAPSSGATNGNGLFPDPRPVKTVSVRPDGSVITGGDLSAPRTPATPVASLTPSMASNPPVPVARPSAAAPAPTPAAPKTTARATAAASVAAATPATPAPAAAQPQAEARAPMDRTASTNASGDFAIQLAAPGSEAEARQVMTRLTQRFGSELGGRKLTFKKAAVGDKSVYRVRISGLSRENATSLCTKLQAKGGNCFVAKN